MTDGFSNDRCRRTRDTLDEAGIRALLTLEEDDGPTEALIHTHDGEWRREARRGGDVWRWWKLPVDLELSVLQIELAPAQERTSAP